ncbi:EamA family transporter [Candidatus Kaiserbacteria bacterium]|nr:MAG: EamA family transporter [Candidatus Kaiserbacteria bacterium]
MNWILLAVGAQFLNAFVALVDKHIVSDEKTLPRPFVYAFYTCLISGVWVVVYFIGFLPFVSASLHIPSFSNVIKPTLEVVALSFLSAYTFFTALVAMFSALRDHDASDVVPVIGSVSALASFGMGYYFFNTTLSHNFIFGIILLSVGTFLVSRLQFPVKTAMVALYSGIFFALHYITIKGLFLSTSFDNGFFWSRIAFVFFAGTLLMIPNYFEKIKEQTKSTTKGTAVLVIVNKLLAGVSTILILKATDLGDVAVVQALGGLQFVFILLLGIFFSMRPTKLNIGETYDRGTILKKVLFVTVITLGFLVLFR